MTVTPSRWLEILIAAVIATVLGTAIATGVRSTAPTIPPPPEVTTGALDAPVTRVARDALSLPPLPDASVLELHRVALPIAGIPLVASGSLDLRTGGMALVARA